MKRFQIVTLVGAAAMATSAIHGGPLPSAQAAPCPDAEVLFARGTTELPGLGSTGEAFVNSLRSQLGAKSVEVYAVDYPATTEFRTAIDGISDARTRILTTAANCPETKMVLGGFSQGAAVMGFVTANAVPDGVTALDVPEPMPLDVADHVAAVALFGKPSARFMRVINDPQIVIGPNYVGKTIDLCVDDDLVCDPEGSNFSVHTQYPETGMVEQGATFVAQKLQASWAEEGAGATPSTSAPTTSSPPPAPLSTLAAAGTPPEHLGSTQQTLPGPAPRPGPAAPAGSSAPAAPLA